MPFRNLVAAPEDLAKLSAAFDLAWIQINHRTPIDDAGQAKAKEQLGYILIALWGEYPTADLADLAVSRYLLENADDGGSGGSQLLHPSR